MKIVKKSQETNKNSQKVLRDEHEWPRRLRGQARMVKNVQERTVMVKKSQGMNTNGQEGLKNSHGW